MTQQTCNHEITLTGDNESDSAFCGFPASHAGPHGDWQR